MLVCCVGFSVPPSSRLALGRQGQVWSPPQLQGLAPSPGVSSGTVSRGGIFGWVLLRVKPANQACLNPTRPHSLATTLPSQPGSPRRVERHVISHGGAAQAPP